MPLEKIFDYIYNTLGEKNYHILDSSFFNFLGKIKNCDKLSDIDYVIDNGNLDNKNSKSFEYLKVKPRKGVIKIYIMESNFDYQNLLLKKMDNRFINRELITVYKEEILFISPNKNSKLDISDRDFISKIPVAIIEILLNNPIYLKSEFYI